MIESPMKLYVHDGSVEDCQVLIMLVKQKHVIEYIHFMMEEIEVDAMMTVEEAQAIRKKFKKMRKLDMFFVQEITYE